MPSDAPAGHTRREGVEQTPPAEAPADDKPAQPKAEATKPSDALTDFLGSRQGKTLQREVIRGAFSLLRKRR